VYAATQLEVMAAEEVCDEMDVTVKFGARGKARSTK
jgi:hypothetical protein